MRIETDKLKHISQVADACYDIAKVLNMSETDCRKAYTYGFMHDIGYAFCETMPEHPDVGTEMFKSIGGENILPIKYHGKKTDFDDVYLIIVSMADMMVDKFGNKVTMNERIADIKSRYGEESHQYKNAIECAEYLKTTKEYKATQ